MNLSLVAVSKTYGQVDAVKQLDLTVASGSLVALLGPSGCGKTTTLRMIAGFEQPDAGQVLLGDKDITSFAPHRRRIGMVFQNYSLFPHMTVFDNVAFGLRRTGCKRGEVKPRVDQALDMVRMAGCGERWPSQLSGGQQQRVALARSIVTNPSVLLLDEPLGALDKNLRVGMQFELRQMQRSIGITTVLVTHDQEEALTMSDQIAVMHQGRLVQLGPPSDIYHRPSSRFVAEFLGTSNIFEATASGYNAGRLRAQHVDTGTVLEVAHSHAASGRVAIAVRPEKIGLTVLGNPGANVLAGVIISVVFRGAYFALQIALRGNRQIVLAYLNRCTVDGVSVGIGTRVAIYWAADDAVALTDQADST